MDATAEEINKHVRTYLLVFAALAVLTVVTVGASFVDLGKTGNIAVALVIATCKASLVAAFFMHLVSERQLIYGLLALAAVFFVVVLLVPLATTSDMAVVPESIVRAPASHDVPAAH